MCDCVSARFYCNIHVLKMLFNFVSWRLTMIINYFIAPGSIEKYRFAIAETTLVVDFGNSLRFEFDWQNVRSRAQ